MNQDNKKYYLQDLESGEEYIVSKEEYEQYNALLKQMNIIVDGTRKLGTVIIVGTGGENEYNAEEFKKLWNDAGKEGFIYPSSENIEKEMQEIVGIPIKYFGNE